MICGKCLAKNKDNAKFCVKCGEKLNNNQLSKSEPVSRLNSHGSANGRYRKSDIAAIVILIILAIGIIVDILGSRSYEKTAGQFVDAVYNADIKTILELMPKAIVESMLEDEYDSQQEMFEDLEESIQNAIIDEMEMYIGEDWKLTHKVLSVDYVYSGEFNKIKEDYKEKFDIEVLDAKIVRMELRIKAKGYDESEDAFIHLVKVGRSWYIDAVNTSLHFKSIGKTLYFY